MFTIALCTTAFGIGILCGLAPEIEGNAQLRVRDKPLLAGVSIVVIGNLTAVVTVPPGQASTLVGVFAGEALVTLGFSLFLTLRTRTLAPA